MTQSSENISPSSIFEGHCEGPNILDPDSYTTSSRCYYNEHTLYVKSGVASNEQLMKSMRQSLINVSKKLGRSVPCSFKSNLIIGRNGVYYGFGYLWVTNPEVYHMLLGRNPDGTERVECYDDPNWIKPTNTLEDALSEITYKSGSWADMTDTEEEIIQTYTCPKIKVQLPPLMELPGYDYDDEQLTHFQRLAEKFKNEEVTDPSVLCCDGTTRNGVLTIPKKGYFQIAPACVKDPDEKHCRNVLCSRNIPTWIVENDLKNAFKFYASDNKTVIERKIKKKTIKDTYPFVTINDKRVAFVTFDPNTADAQFALLMTRKLVLVKGEGTPNQQNVTLVFDHSFQTSSRGSNGDY